MSNSINPVIQIGRNRFKHVLKGELIEEPGFAGGWRRKGHAVIFVQFDGVERVALVDNRYKYGMGESPFFVTCRPEPSSPSGLYFMQATSSVDEEWLGISGMGYRDTIKTAERLASETGIAPIRELEPA